MAFAQAENRFYSNMKTQSRRSQWIQRLAPALPALILACLPSYLAAEAPKSLAVVTSLTGKASYSSGNDAPKPLTRGTKLGAISSITTGAGSSVDIFLGKGAGVIRLTAKSTLQITTLQIADTGADTLVQVELELRDGTLLGNVNKLSAASIYEIRLPDGLATVRGTRYRLSANCDLMVLSGSVHLTCGNLEHVVTGPPAIFYRPGTGIQTPPPEIIEEFVDLTPPPFIPATPPIITEPPVSEISPKAPPKDSPKTSPK
jgi:hypothetical protein